MNRGLSLTTCEMGLIIADPVMDCDLIGEEICWRNRLSWNIEIFVDFEVKCMCIFQTHNN